jgi:hypothetical protein
LRCTGPHVNLSTCRVSGSASLSGQRDIAEIAVTTLGRRLGALDSRSGPLQLLGMEPMSLGRPVTVLGKGLRVVSPRNTIINMPKIAQCYDTAMCNCKDTDIFYCTTKRQIADTRRYRQCHENSKRNAVVLYVVSSN